jgi:hemolysin III
MHGPERLTLGKMQHPVRGFLHGSAAVVAAVGMGLLLNGATHTRTLLSLLVYGVTLVGLYVTSSLYHAVPWQPVWKARLQRLDHTVIYVLVAGTSTPLIVGILNGWWAQLGLGLVWSLAAVGAAREFVPRFQRYSLPLLVAIIAATLVPLFRMLSLMSPLVAVLTVGGGVVYLSGVTMLVKGWPRLLPRVFSYHEVFHVLVILASLAHFFAIREVMHAG